jgi:hypothetical protein
MKQDHIVDTNKMVTAVEWLVEQLFPNWMTQEQFHMIEQAKVMEKDQISKAWNDGDYAYFYSKETGREFDNGEQYYNEMYNKQTMSKEQAKTELIKLLQNQIADLVLMSKIELGDDVIAEINRLKLIIGE